MWASDSLRNWSGTDLGHETNSKELPFPLAGTLCHTWEQPAEPPTWQAAQGMAGCSLTPTKLRVWLEMPLHLLSRTWEGFMCCKSHLHLPVVSVPSKNWSLATHLASLLPPILLAKALFFFLVFQGEHFPHFAILIWTPGLELTARNCENGLTFIGLTHCCSVLLIFLKKVINLSYEIVQKGHLGK